MLVSLHVNILSLASNFETVLRCTQIEGLIMFYSLVISSLFVENSSVERSPFLCSFLDITNVLLVYLFHIRCPKYRIFCSLKLARTHTSYFCCSICT